MVIWSHLSEGRSAGSKGNSINFHRLRRQQQQRPLFSISILIKTHPHHIPWPKPPSCKFITGGFSRKTCGLIPSYKVDHHMIITKLLGNPDIGEEFPSKLRSVIARGPMSRTNAGSPFGLRERCIVSVLSGEGCWTLWLLCYQIYVYIICWILRLPLFFWYFSVEFPWKILDHPSFGSWTALPILLPGTELFLRTTTCSVA